MIGTFAGALHKKGSFVNDTTGEVVDYDNLVLTILIPVKSGGPYDPIESVGHTVDTTAKCSFSNISYVFGREVTQLSDLAPFLGSEIEYYYDSNKKLDKVIFHE